MSTEKLPEPAMRSYFFDKGYRDLVATIRASWEKNLASAAKELKAAASLFPEHWGAKALGVLRGSAGISILVFGAICFLAFSLVHVTLLLLLFLLIYLVFSLLYLAERLYIAVKGFFSVCPECHEKVSLSHYLCPRCGEVHRRLIPSSYGILRRTCLCGEKLPTTFWGGRGAIPARCPRSECQHLLSASIAESRKHFIPIYGGPAVGKSAFLVSGVSELIDQMPSRGFECFFLEERAAQGFERLREQLARGRAPDKTRDTIPRAFNLEVQKAGQDRRLLYLYDPAGELFASEEDLVAQRYQAYLSGLVFVLDPFSLPQLERRYRDRMTELGATLAPSQLHADDALNRFLLGLEQHFGLARGGKIRKPVAVVINKIDAFGLEGEVGESALEEALRQAGPGATAESVQNQVLREQLQNWGAGDLVHQLEERCAVLRYFACTALGRMPDGSDRPFTGRGVLAPLAWILGKGDPGLRLGDGGAGR